MFFSSKDQESSSPQYYRTGSCIHDTTILLDGVLSVQVDQSEQLFSAIANVTGSSDSPLKLHERYRRLTSLEGVSQCIPNLDE